MKWRCVAPFLEGLVLGGFVLFCSVDSGGSGGGDDGSGGSGTFDADYRGIFRFDTGAQQAALAAGRTRFNLRAHWLIPVFYNAVQDAYLFDFPDALPQAKLEVVYRP